MDSWERSLEDLARRLARQGTRPRALAPRTQATYLEDCRLVARWMAAQGLEAPERISASALEACFRELGWSAATRRRALTSTREWLAPLFPPNRSPADLVQAPRVVQPTIPRLSQADAAALLDGLDPGVGDDRRVARALALRDRALLEVLYGSGLRRQEACDLVLAAVDFEHETLRVQGKGGKARTVPLTEPAIDALRAWLAEGRPRLVSPGVFAPAGRAHLFVSRRGRPLDGSTVYRIVARELRRAGRAGGPHLLRHAAGTHLLEGPDGTGGAHLRVVQEVLGHSSLATTQRYTGVTTRAMQGALRRGHPRG